MTALYGKAIEVKNVKIQVPQKGPYMEFIPAHDFKIASGEEIPVADHWRSSSFIHGQLVQRNFFGITQKELGKKIVGKVHIKPKKTSRSKKNVSLIDIWYDPEKSAEYKIAFEKDEAGELQFSFYEIWQPKKKSVA